ncbi:hypothetical protein [Paenibacillus lemnae]|uniref:Uncharacterized protein n=1 Tax=Paenibacillus lemnae TaxID=1330551 RepID=A0A848MDF1_PAELE|nr:hypothetical protein [Paenibacillus lemnae]NMO98113.1 hypothetical protein [Paenibacillus lemnae]
MNMAGKYDKLIHQVIARIYEADPSLLEQYGERGRMKCREDNIHHLRHLETALELEDTTVFTDYALWLEGILRKHAMKTNTLTDNFRYIEQYLHLVDTLDKSAELAYRKYLTDAILALEQKTKH